MPIPEPLLTPLRPDEIRLRMEELRTRYQRGVIVPDVYKSLCNQFQFRDATGHLWSIGATSCLWYRWDISAWTQAEPPTELFFADEALEKTTAWMTTERAAMAKPASSAYVCTCGAVSEVATRFCPECGAPRQSAPTFAAPRLEQAPTMTAQWAQQTAPMAAPRPQQPQPITAPWQRQAPSPPAFAPPPPSPSKPVAPAATPSATTCRACGKPILPNHKFCRACGTTVG
jgi:ribosomal protein L32